MSYGGIAYEESEESGFDSLLAPQSRLPDDYPEESSRQLPQPVARFVCSVGPLSRLHAYFPGPFAHAVASLEALESRDWFAGQIPDSLAVTLMRDRAEETSGGKEGQKEAEAADGFGYGEETLDEGEGRFGYGEDEEASRSAEGNASRDLFLIRFSRHADGYAVVVLDSRRGVRKWLVRRHGDGQLRLRGASFETIDDVAAHFLSQGYGTVPACAWRVNHTRVLDELFSMWLSSRGVAKLFSSTAEELDLWRCGCFYGKATDGILSQLMQDAGDPKAFCLRFGSQPGSLTLAVSKPDKQGSNKKFPHYFKFSLTVKAAKFTVKGWKEGGTPPSDCMLAELITWLEDQGYSPFVAPGAWGRTVSREEVDPEGRGVVNPASIIGEWDGDRVAPLGEVHYARQHDFEVDTLRQVLSDDSSIRNSVTTVMRKHFGENVELIDHGALTLATVHGLEAAQLARKWIVVVEDLVPQVYLQTPLYMSGGCVSFVDAKGAVLDVLVCVEGKKMIDTDGSSFRSLPAAVPLARLWLQVGFMLLSHAPTDTALRRSDILGLLSNVKRESLKDVVAALPWLKDKQEPPSALLAASLVSHQEYLAGLPARSTGIMQALKASLHVMENVQSSPVVPKAMIPSKFVKLESKIGGGAFGEVWRAKLGSGGRIAIDVAVKKLLSRDKELEDEIIHEAALLDRIRHPAVIEFFGLSRDEEGRLLVVTELMPGGSLLSWICKMPKQVDRTRITIAKDICIGLSYVHLIGVVHRDVAARNVLLSASSDPIRVKLCDFGLGTEAEMTDEKKRFPIAVPWCAPEAIKYKFSCQSDIWSYGVTIMELYSEGMRLYEDWGDVSPFSRNVPAFLHQLKNGRRLAKPFLCPQPLYDVILRCWEFAPQDRCSLEDVLDVLDVLEVELAAAEDEARRCELQEYEGYFNSAYDDAEVESASYVEI